MFPEGIKRTMEKEFKLQQKDQCSTLWEFPYSERFLCMQIDRTFIPQPLSESTFQEDTQSQYSVKMVEEEDFNNSPAPPKIRKPMKII